MKVSHLASMLATRDRRFVAVATLRKREAAARLVTEQEKGRLRALDRKIAEEVLGGLSRTTAVVLMPSGKIKTVVADATGPKGPRVLCVEEGELR